MDIELSPERLPGLERLQQTASSGLSTLEAQVTALQDRGRQTQRALTRRVEVAYGQLRDNALGHAYGLSSSALATSSTIARRAGDLTRLSLLERPANRLDSCSRVWSRRQDAVLSPPIAGYDDLNVGGVKEAVASLTHYDLLKTRDYEVAHKNRVTVLRDLDRLLS